MLTSSCPALISLKHYLSAQLTICFVYIYKIKWAVKLIYVWKIGTIYLLATLVHLSVTARQSCAKVSSENELNAVMKKFDELNQASVNKPHHKLKLSTYPLCDPHWAATSKARVVDGVSFCWMKKKGKEPMRQRKMDKKHMAVLLFTCVISHCCLCW